MGQGSRFRGLGLRVESSSVWIQDEFSGVCRSGIGSRELAEKGGNERIGGWMDGWMGKRMDGEREWEEEKGGENLDVERQWRVIDTHIVGAERDPDRNTALPHFATNSIVLHWGTGLGVGFSPPTPRRAQHRSAACIMVQTLAPAW